jgi:hypothetical protein
VSEPRILLYDIETAPLTSYNWGIWKQNAIKVKEEWFILSVAWKWLGKKRVECVALPDFTLYDTEPHNDLYVVAQVAELLNAADVVVAHNGNHFDQPKVRARMAVHGLDPPTPFKEVDTLLQARKHFKFTSNRLDALCRELGIGAKRETGGFPTWEGCMNGDPRAWDMMKRYNRHDIGLLEQLYLRLLPWMSSLPNLAVLGDRPDSCPKCGGGPLQSRGWRYYQVARRRCFRCHACGGISYGRSLEKTDAKRVP